MAATHTTNFGLNKPDRQDFVSVVTDINDNMDILDNLNGDIIPIGEGSGTMIREYIDNGMAEVVPEYDDGETYAVGDIVCNDGLNYRCKTAISMPESFTPAKWQRITLAEVVAENSKEIPKLQNGLAVIVDGDTCATAVPAGGYAYIRNNTHGLANGLYKNTSSSAFPVSGGTANSTVFTAAPGGLGGEVAALNNKLTMIYLGILPDISSLVTAISSVASTTPLGENETRFVKFNTNVPTDYWAQWEWHTGVLQIDAYSSTSVTWTAVFVGTTGDTLSVSSSGNYFSSKEEKSRISSLDTSTIEFYGFTLGQAKAITAKPYKRGGIAFGVWSTNRDSMKIIPFRVSIPANATTLTINSVNLYDVGEVISGSYDVAIMTWRAS